VSAGDELLAIDGRAVTAASLHEIRELLRQPDKTYKLTIARGGEQKELTLKTRRMV
jgi:C-terminal processing protease CtpA/Prc